MSWGLAMVIDLVPVLVRYFISASWGHVSEHLKNRLEAYDAVKNTVKPLFYAASGWVSWNIIFGNIYQLYNPGDPDKSRALYTKRVRTHRLHYSPNVHFLSAARRGRVLFLLCIGDMRETNARAFHRFAPGIYLRTAMCSTF